LLKLGFEVAQSTVAKYMVKRRGPPGYAPIATKFCVAAKCRDGPKGDIGVRASAPAGVAPIVRLVWS
jgi:hypothetical protein